MNTTSSRACLKNHCLEIRTQIRRRVLEMGLAVLVAWGLASTVAQGAEAGGSGCVLVEKEGKVEVARKGTTAFKPVDSGAALHYGHQLQTGSRSRATLRWSDLSMTRVDELTGIEIHPPAPTRGGDEQHAL